MGLTEQELNKMYNWIFYLMKEDTWYPVKSEKAFDVITHLFKEGSIDFCELNSDETNFRKIDIELLEL